MENVVKKPAKFPNSNFLNVVPTQLSRGTYQSLVLQAGSVDITNLVTNINSDEFMEYFKQETVISANNFFQAGVNALSTSPSLERVVMMKQIPRYDSSLKSSLSKLYNDTITELWMKSPLKNQIVIGSHNLECTGGIRAARYSAFKTNKYDGIHMYGSSGQKAYTHSVLSIFKVN